MWQMVVELFRTRIFQSKSQLPLPRGKISKIMRQSYFQFNLEIVKHKINILQWLSQCLDLKRLLHVFSWQASLNLVKHYRNRLSAEISSRHHEIYCNGASRLKNSVFQCSVEFSYLNNFTQQSCMFEFKSQLIYYPFHPLKSAHFHEGCQEFCAREHIDTSAQITCLSGCHSQICIITNGSWLDMFIKDGTE